MSFRTYPKIVPVIAVAATVTGSAFAANSLEFKLFLHQGYRSFKVGDYFKARDYFTRAVDLSLRNAEARFALAEALAALGQYNEAVIQMRHGIHLDSNWPEKDYPRFGFYPDQKTMDRYIAKLRLDVAEFPKDANARLVLGYNLFHLGQLTDAVEVFIDAENVLGKKDPLARAYLATMKTRGVSPAEPPPAAAGSGSTPAAVPATSTAPTASPDAAKTEPPPADASGAPPPPPDAAASGDPSTAPPPPPDAGGSPAPSTAPPPPDVPKGAAPKGK